MTKEELDFIGSMNECDEISNEAYAKISAHCEILGTCKDCLLAEEINESTIWCVCIHSYPQADFYCKYYERKE